MPAPDQFMNTYSSRLDAKGRISIPAPFRAVLRSIAEDGAATLVLRPSHKHDCIEAWPPARFEAWAAKEKAKFEADPDADEDDLAIRVFASSVTVDPDKEGRIVLEDFLAEHAGVKEAVVCLGMGDRFQIWEAEAGERRKQELRAGLKRGPK